MGVVIKIVRFCCNMEWSSVALHLFGVLSVLHLYKSDHTVLSTDCSTTNILCNTTATKLIDYVSPTILELEIKPTLQWLAIIVFLVYTLYLAIKVYKAMFGRYYIIYKQRERDIGYIVPLGKTKKDIANMVRRKRLVGDIPPPYPNGWYELMRSEDLPVGQSRAINMNDEHFAVFRNKNNQVFVTDAYCPHLGANLGVGGIVVGNCIECPFHGWQFDGETGECTAVPYASKVPKFVKIKIWPSMEVNGLILVWYDAEGREPYFTVPEYPQIKSGRWTFKGSSVHYINCHLEDISENGADISHLKAVHETGVQAGSQTHYKSSWLGKIVTHEWKVNWEQLPPPNSHIGRMTLSVTNKLFGRWSLKPLDFHVSVDQVGPGVVHLDFNFIFGKGVFIQTDVPEEPLMQRLTHYIYCDWWIPTFIATWLLLNGDAIQIERDALIWGNKRYVGKPNLVKEDQLILAHRRWFSQFYSENSVRMTFKKENTLTW